MKERTTQASGHPTEDRTLINGVRSEYLNVMDRAIHYGDGIFETILCLPAETSDEDESSGSRKLCYWHQHYQRLKDSAERLQLDCPEEQLLLADIRKLFDDNVRDITQVDACVIKIILTRGVGDRGYRYPKKQAA